MTETVPQYEQNVESQTGQLLRDADAEVSVLTGGPFGETVSARVALDSQEGAVWARWFCAALSLMVQPGHCAAMRGAAPVPWYAYPRAALCFLAVIVGLPWLPFWPPAAWIWGALLGANALVGVVLLWRAR